MTGQTVIINGMQSTQVILSTKTVNTIWFTVHGIVVSQHWK